MKKALLITALSAIAFAGNAQTFNETFDSNTMGWTEEASSRGEALVKDGVLHLVSKGTTMMSSCYTNLDVKKNFEIKCKVNVKKIDAGNPIGIIFNYLDDYNYCLFGIDEEMAYFKEFRDNQLVGYRRNALKLKGKRKVELDFAIKSTYNRVQFEVNNMTAIELRFKPLVSNGIGFYIVGNQTADFDNLEIIQ